MSVAIVIAIGVNADGQREVLGLDLGPRKDGAFWHAFLRSLIARGLSGVKLVTSDAHQGLTGAIAAVLQGWPPVCLAIRTWCKRHTNRGWPGAPRLVQPAGKPIVPSGPPSHTYRSPPAHSRSYKTTSSWPHNG